jgi:hypothetical protein
MPAHATNGAKQKAKRQSARILCELDKTSGAARYYNKMLRDIASDLGGRRLLTRIEEELIKGFAGSATRLEYLTHQLLLGDVTEVDLASYSQLTSNLVRISTRLGLGRRARDVTPSLNEILRHDEMEAADDVAS